jgi:hypothetical protein
VRVGVTGIHEENGIGEQDLLGADLLLRLGEGSFFELEWAQSQGNGFATVRSTDGGFLFNPTVQGQLPPGPAEAWRFKAIADMQDFGWAVPARFGVNYEEREAGFSAPGRASQFDERISGAFAEVGDRDTALVSARYQRSENSDGARTDEITGEATVRFSQRWSATAGVQHSLAEGGQPGSDTDGGRTDLGGRLTYHIDEDRKVWLSGQTTLQRDGERERNDRVGVGMEMRLNELFTGSTEVSWGTSGLGLLGSVNYAPNASDTYNVGYRLAPEVSAGGIDGYDPFGSDYGEIVLGAKRKLSETVSVFGEENLDLTGDRQAILHSYGVTLEPAPQWKISLSTEAGEITDSVNGDFDRVAGSAGVSYKDEGIDGAARLEARFEDSVADDTRDRTTWLGSMSGGVKVSQDWRFLAGFDAVLSQSQEDTILDGDFIEGSVGYAYRPADGGPLNALFKYTYLYDLPGPQQVNASGEEAGPRQRSHVASADFIYDINQYLSVGGKYGIRIGEVARDRERKDFVESTAQLAVARADFHIVHQWDLMVEARMLWLSELEQAQLGAVAGIYRHVGDHLKVGVGYNFGRFSDDLTDLTLDDEGVFVNVIGKF